MNIQSVVSVFPDFAKSWAEHRLTRLFNRTGSLPNEDALTSVKDYLASLSPEDRIYQKLNKISWNDMVQLQKNWHDALAAKAAKMTEFGGDAEAKTFIDCENGYRWVKLETPEQFDFEGNAMGHCIGQGGYDESKNQFYSLRDSKNLPHVTVEFNPKNKSYLQIQGRANKPVIADYWEDTVKLFNVLGEENGPEKFAHDREYVCSDSKMYFEPEDIKRAINDDSVFVASARIENTSFGITTKGKFLYLTEEPPEGTSFKTVKLYKDSNIRDWKWDVADNFDVHNSLLETVPAGVKFGGNVNISGTRIKHWHNDVHGNFTASESLLETVAANVEFGGNVNIGETRIKHWHNDVSGDFYAYFTLLETIANNVKFGGNVNIGGTRIKHFNNNVPGNFNASASLLETIAAHVKFGGDVNINITKIKHLHNDVLGDFFAQDSLLEIVSDNVKFGGAVDIRGTRIKHWQHDVHGNFYAYDTLLESVSADVKFGGNVNIEGTRIKHWHNDVHGDFYASNSLLKTVSTNVKFGGHVDISGTTAARLLAETTKPESHIMPLGQ